MRTRIRAIQEKGQKKKVGGVETKEEKMKKRKKWARNEKQLNKLHNDDSNKKRRSDNWDDGKQPNIEKNEGKFEEHNRR